jgi:hypothetical protein
MEQMLTRALRGARLTVLVGPPRVGKTTLLRAGVLPLLARRAGDGDRPSGDAPRTPLPFPDRRARAEGGGPRERLYVVDQWDQAAMDTLARALDERPPDDGAEAMSPARLSALSRSNGGARLLFVLDHFEQLFQGEQRNPELRRFIEAWAASVQSRDLGAVHFLIAVDEVAWSRMHAVRAGVLDDEIRLFRLHVESGRRVLDPLTDSWQHADATVRDGSGEPIEASIDDIVSQVAKSVRDARAVEFRPEDVAASMNALVRRVTAAAEAEREAKAAPYDDAQDAQNADGVGEATHAGQVAEAARQATTEEHAVAERAAEALRLAQAQRVAEVADAERRAAAEERAEAVRRAQAAQAEASRLAQALAAAEAAAAREAQAREAAEAAAKEAQAGRLAEAERHAQAERDADLARQAEAGRRAEAHRLAEALAAAEAAAVREAQAREAAEAAAKAAQAGRLAETERHAQAERDAEVARQAEAEAHRLAQALAAAEAVAVRESQARQVAEAERRAQAERHAEAARQAEAARLADANRLANALAAAEAATVRERKAREAAEASLADAVAEAASRPGPYSEALPDEVVRPAMHDAFPAPPGATIRPARTFLLWGAAALLAGVTALLLWWPTPPISTPATESAAAPGSVPAAASSPAGISAASPAPVPVARYELVTATPGAAHARIAGELASALAADPAWRVTLLPTRADPIADLGKPGRLVVAHLDALRAARTDATLRLRVLTPLFPDTVLFVVPADSPLKFIRDLRGRRLSIGPVQGDGSYTVRAIYRQLFGAELAEPRQLDDDQALAELVGFRSIDAMAVVVPRASTWWESLEPRTAQRLRLLTLDPNHPTDRRLLQALGTPAVRTAANATRRTSATTPTVMSFLVAPGEGDADAERLTAMANSLCRELPALRRKGHPQWLELQPAAQLDTGWPVVRPFQSAISRCARVEGGATDKRPKRPQR